MCNTEQQLRQENENKTVIIRHQARQLVERDRTISAQQLDHQRMYDVLLSIAHDMDSRENGYPSRCDEEIKAEIERVLSLVYQPLFVKKNGTN